MFDFIQKHKKLIQIGLFVIIFPPFLFFGIDQYFRYSEGGQGVATVGDYTISQQEFSKALQDRQRTIQRMAQGRVDAAMLDNPELRYATLETLIQRRVLLDRAMRSGMTVSEQQLKAAIATVPVFQDEKSDFSYARYEQFLKAEGQTPVTFEARLRHDLILQQLTVGYAESAFVPRTTAERLVKLAEQQREVSLFTINPTQFASQVKLAPDADRKYYEANRSEFEIPEQIRVEYVTLSVDGLMPQVQIDPAEIPKYYAANRAQFEKRESRARHILIAIEPDAGAEAKQKARAKANDIYRQVQKKPQAFEELARQYSQDPGSAAKGGDLGFVTLGAMKDVPEFEEALFKLKEGEISPPVESKLGFHIIQATEVRGARGRSLEEMRPQLEAELKKLSAGKMFAELAEKFNNTVYEQSESLKPAAELVKTQVRQSGWITRGRAEEPLLNSPKVLQAVFSEEVLKNKRNTEAIEAAPNTLVAARVIEHKAATIQPFEQVQGNIEKKLVSREAARLAVQDGKAKLDLLRQGKEAQLAWSSPQLISRAEQKGLAEPVLRQAFRADAAKLPSYAGVDNSQGGYTLIRITRVVDPQEVAPEKRQTFGESLRRILGQEELTAYVMSIKQKAGVKINKEHLERKER
jgi:peptidyl-prolyl cis-trans isomerase D